MHNYSRLPLRVAADLPVDEVAVADVQMACFKRLSFGEEARLHLSLRRHLVALYVVGELLTELIG